MQQFRIVQTKSHNPFSGNIVEDGAQMFGLIFSPKFGNIVHVLFTTRLFTLVDMVTHREQVTKQNMGLFSHSKTVRVVP